MRARARAEEAEATVRAAQRALHCVLSAPETPTPWHGEPSLAPWLCAVSRGVPPCCLPRTRVRLLQGAGGRVRRRGQVPEGVGAANSGGSAGQGGSSWRRGGRRSGAGRGRRRTGQGSGPSALQGGTNDQGGGCRDLPSTRSARLATGGGGRRGRGGVTLAHPRCARSSVWSSSPRRRRRAPAPAAAWWATCRSGWRDWSQRCAERRPSEPGFAQSWATPPAAPSHTRSLRHTRTQLEKQLEASESQCARLEAEVGRGSFNPATTKVVHLARNPAREAREQWSNEVGTRAGRGLEKCVA